MKTRIIGNSQGVRIAKPFLEQAGLQGEVEITAEGDSLVIRPLKKLRDGWASAFQDMAPRGDDVLIHDAPTLSTWDEDEWAWR